MKNNWCENLKKYWLDKDIDKIVNLFDENVLYYETPFEEIKDLRKVWSDIEEQTLNSLEYKIMCEKDNVIVANYIMNDNGNIVDMVYDIELNDEGKCIYFKQWYMVGE